MFVCLLINWKCMVLDVTDKDAIYMAVYTHKVI